MSHHHYCHDDVRLVLILHICKCCSQQAGCKVYKHRGCSAQQMQDISGPLAVLPGETISCTMGYHRACQKATCYVLSKSGPEIILSFHDASSHFPAGKRRLKRLISPTSAWQSVHSQNCAVLQRTNICVVATGNVYTFLQWFVHLARSCGAVS